MGKILLTIGEPGTGKSRAIKNLDPKTTVIIKPNNKDLPFAGARRLYKDKENSFRVSSFIEVGKLLRQINKGDKFKTVIVEDITHLFNRRVMKDSHRKDFDKWNEMATEAYFGLLGYEDELREDLYVILTGHIDHIINSDGDSITQLLTPGKLLDKSVKIQSWVTYIFHTEVKEEEGAIKYSFLTNKDGSGREAKSPEGCLDLHEENDYKAIIEKIEAYQNK